MTKKRYIAPYVEFSLIEEDGYLLAGSPDGKITTDTIFEVSTEEDDKNSRTAKEAGLFQDDYFEDYFEDY